MIELTIELLSLDNYYNGTELIEIAKGKYSIPRTKEQKKEQNKRLKKWQRTTK